MYLNGGQGIGSPWQATSYAHLSASSGKVLWTRNDTGQAALWTINPDTGAVGSAVYVNGGVGIGAPWQAASYTQVSDSVGFVLWTRSDTGVAALWQVNPVTGAVASGVYVNGGIGIGGPWQATSYTHLSATSGEVLWTRSDTGVAALWTGQSRNRRGRKRGVRERRVRDRRPLAGHELHKIITCDPSLRSRRRPWVRGWARGSAFLLNHHRRMVSVKIFVLTIR